MAVSRIPTVGYAYFSMAVDIGYMYLKGNRPFEMAVVCTIVLLGKALLEEVAHVRVDMVMC